MPRLSSRGSWVGGLGNVGQVFLDWQMIGPGDGPVWLDDHVIVFQRDGRIVEFLAPTTVSVVSPFGANKLAAGGGTWAAYLDQGSMAGVRDHLGRHFSTSALLDVGRDGTKGLVSSRITGQGITLLHDGFVPLDIPDAVPLDTYGQVLDHDQVLWAQLPGPRVHVYGIPDPQTLDGPVWWPRAVAVDGVWWLLYQDGHGRLILHPFSEPVGYVITTGPTFRPDVVRLADGRLRIVWATTEGEIPDSVQIRDIALTQARMDLRVATDPPPPPEPPEPLPMPYVRRSPDYSSHVKAFADQNPTLWESARERPDGTRDDACIRALAWWMHKNIDANIGLNGKRGGDTISTDALAYKNETALGGAEVIDVIGGGNHNPQWRDVTLPDVKGKFIQPTDPGTGDPPPPPPPDTTAERLRVLEEGLSQLITLTQALAARVTALEARPPADVTAQIRQVLSGALVEGRTANASLAWTHAHTFTGSIRLPQ